MSEKEKHRFTFKYKCDDCYDDKAETIIKPYRKGCDVCNVKEVCYGDAGIAKSEGELPEEKVCPFSGNKLTLKSYDYIDPRPIFTILTKMSKSDIKVDRKVRAANHFKKEIFPTLPKSEQIHFMHKYPDLKPTVNVHKKS